MSMKFNDDNYNLSDQFNFFLKKYGIDNETSFKFESKYGQRDIDLETILKFIRFSPKWLTLKLTKPNTTKTDFLDNLRSLAHFIVAISSKYLRKAIENIKTISNKDNQKIRFILNLLYREGFEFYDQYYDMTERDKNLKELHFNPYKPLTISILSLERFDKMVRTSTGERTIDYYIRSTKENNRIIFNSLMANTDDINFSLSRLNWYPSERNRIYTYDIIEFGMFTEIPKEQYKDHQEYRLSVANHYNLIERVYEDISFDDISKQLNDIDHLFISIPLYSCNIKPTDFKYVFTKIKLNDPLNSLAN